MITSNEVSNQLRKMRWVSGIEGTTLILLVFVAVPLKHIFNIPQATAVMGPIHGLAFVTYVWMLIQTLSIVDFSRFEVARMILAAFIPFGGFYNERALARRQHPRRKN